MPNLEQTAGTPATIARAVRKDLQGEKLSKTDEVALGRYHEAVIAKSLSAMSKRSFASLIGQDSRQLAATLRRSGMANVGVTVRPPEVLGEAFERLAAHEKNADRLEAAATVSKLAEAVGATRKRVAEWQATDAWPFGDAGPFPVAAVRRWAEIQREQAETSDKLGELEIAIKQEDLRKRRLMNAELAGRMVDREAARARLFGLMRAWGAGLLAMCAPTARQLLQQGLIEDDQISEAEMVIETAVRQVCATFAEAGESVVAGDA